MLRLLPIKNRRRRILRRHSSSINVLILSIFRKLTMLLHRRRHETFLLKVRLVMSNSREFAYKHWEDNSSWRIMRRLLSISIRSRWSPIRWKVVVVLLMIKSSWTKWHTHTLSFKFDYIATTIEETKDMAVMKVEEL